MNDNINVSGPLATVNQTVTCHGCGDQLHIRRHIDTFELPRSEFADIDLTGERWYCGDCAPVMSK